MKLKGVLKRVGVAAVVLASLMAGGVAAADPLPQGWAASNLKPLAYVTAKGPRVFKLTLKQKGAKWYLIGATGSGPGAGFAVFDVTDPAQPRLVREVAVPNADGQITHHDDLLIVGQQGTRYDQKAAFQTPFGEQAPTMQELATLFDISDPESPRRLSAWTAKGYATHRNVYPGGRYAYMSAWLEGYKGQAIMTVLDVSDPAHPRQVGEWHQPGQKAGEPDRPPPNGFHGPANVSADGRMLTAGYAPSVVNLDIRDPAHPKLIGALSFSTTPSLGAQSVHTVAPMANGFLHVSSEPMDTGCGHEAAPLNLIVDNRDPAEPVVAGYYPRPVPPAGAAFASFCDKEGRFGPHNVNGETHLAEVQKAGPLVWMTYFNAGLRLYDVSNPYDPREVGWFLPSMGPWSGFAGHRGPEDVVVDTRGNAFVSNGRGQGVWVLRYTGPAPAERPLPPRHPAAAGAAHEH